VAKGVKAFLKRKQTADITWWDMLFGTYENPKEWTHTCGFDDAKEQQLLKLLTYHDVHRETE
jgi:sterol desaturase/sphingolipid hydroxylase (fatty acid hydroxylase superfamily)